MIIFLCFALVLLIAAIMAVFSVQTMHSVLWLALMFLAAAGLWIGLNAEFLGITLVLVYVGAIMTLFLFVVMTLPIKSASKTQRKGNISRYSLPIGIALSWFSLIYYAMKASFYSLTAQPAYPLVSKVTPPIGTAAALGQQLYTHYIYPFELIGVLLLITIIVCIRLTYVSSNVHDQPIPKKENLFNIKREERIQLVKDD